MEITAIDGQLAYPRIIEHVLKNGVARKVRDKNTLDAGFTTILLNNPRDAFPVGCGRMLNWNIAAAEAIQLIGGFSQPDLLLKASPAFQQYINGDSFHGAYGARIRMQVPNVIRKLTEDHESRQGVITLWDAHLDNLTAMNDYPCTVALQFETSGNHLLNMNVIMRSNDVWLGLPYDMFQFTQLQLSVARATGLMPGWYRHTALSLHLYETDWKKVDEIHEPAEFPYMPEGIGRPGDSFMTIMKRARRLAAVRDADEFDGISEVTNSEVWYAKRFASYMG